MKKRRENIKNELAYFYKVIKNMDIEDNIKQSKINEHELPINEILYDQFSAGENMDKHLEEWNLLDWIDWESKIIWSDKKSPSRRPNIHQLHS